MAFTRMDREALHNLIVERVEQHGGFAPDEEPGEASATK